MMEISSLNLGVVHRYFVCLVLGLRNLRTTLLKNPSAEGRVFCGDGEWFVVEVCGLSSKLQRLSTCTAKS